MRTTKEEGEVRGFVLFLSVRRREGKRKKKIITRRAQNKKTKEWNNTM
jgi:hypothetical protein